MTSLDQMETLAMVSDAPPYSGAVIPLSLSSSYLRPDSRSQREMRCRLPAFQRRKYPVSNDDGIPVDVLWMELMVYYPPHRNAQTHLSASASCLSNCMDPRWLWC